MTSKLSVGVVCHDTELNILENCLSSLFQEIYTAINEKLISSAKVFVLDNSSSVVYGDGLKALGNRQRLPDRVHLEILTSNNNGFGAGHNKILEHSSADIHLIANPDLKFLPRSITAAVAGLEPGMTGLVLPTILSSEGNPQFLHFRNYSPGSILLRSIAPGFLKKIFRSYMYGAAYRNERTQIPASSKSVFSGCCMLFERSILNKIGGFDEQFFLYFEDYDLSLRALKKTAALIEPEFQVLHHGGNASQKSVRHIYRFLTSGIRFYWGRVKLMAGLNKKEVC